MMTVMLVFTSCEEEKPLLPEMDARTLKSGKELTKMTPEELSAYFESIDLSQIPPGYVETWTDTLSAEEFAQYRSPITLRADYDCGVEVIPYINPGGPDSAYVTVYEAGTTTVYRAKEKLADGESFWMEINGGDYYDFVTEHPNSPTGSIAGYLEIDPDWGSKTLSFFSGNGPHTHYNYNFECPEPSPDGTCEAYLAVRKLAGSSTEYEITITPSVGDEFYRSGFTGDLHQRVGFTCDEDLTYDFEIVSTAGGGTSETVTVSIIRPDGIAHGYTLFNVDLSNNKPEVVTTDFDYFECPY